jgi:Domain of unknown function (DUF4932)
LCLLALAFCGVTLAQTTKAQLEFSESIFTVAAALNSCGFDAGGENSLPLRQTIRAEIQAALRQSPDATQAQSLICQFQREHQPADPSREAAQYVSLALDLGAPPEFTPTLREADLPPDAAQVLGVVPFLQKFYRSTNLHAIWMKHQAEYQGLVQRFHDSVSKTLVQTDLYLKLPFSSYVGRRFVVYLEPLLDPGQVNSRNYSDSYYLVVSPGKDGSLHLNEIRHTYLHYALDPLAQRHTRTLKRLEPLLESVQTAPMETPFKQEIALLVNECLIHAIEARTIPGSKAAEEAREKAVQHSMEEGFILTGYFYQALANFEKESTGMKDAYGDLLYNIDLQQAKKRASEIVFSSQAAPEVVNASRKSAKEERFLDDAEQRLSSGDFAGARQLALQALNNPHSNEDQGRAFFILARAAIMANHIEDAQGYFEKSVQSAHDPRTLAWSHIYLGRIFDIQENRDEAVAHYRSALQAGDPTPDTKTAAEKGLAAPYQKPGSTH